MAPNRPEMEESPLSPPIDQARIREQALELLRAQQSGRTPSNLNAHASASALRNASRSSSRASQRSSSTPNLIQLASSRSIPTLSSENASNSQRQSSHLPAFSSPLASPPEDGEDEETRNSTGESSSESKSSSDLVQTSSERSSNGAPQPRARPSLRSIGALAPRPLSDPNATEMPPLTRRLTSTASVNDLGSDYTRYFNPFATPINSRPGSYHDATTPLPTYFTSEDVRPKTAGDPFATPPKTPLSKAQSADRDAEKSAGLPLFLDDRLANAGMGKYKFPMYVEEVEDDDDMHMPMADDDIRYKAKLSDHFSKENIWSTFGLGLLILGLLFIFIALPALSFSGVIRYSSQDETPLSAFPKQHPIEAWAWVTNDTIPTMTHMRRSLIDKDTPKAAYTMTGFQGEQLELVFSDEFNDNNRTFYPGDDPYWFAPDIWYGATQDLEWYDPDAVTTWNGALELRLDKFPNHGVSYRSGMLNSWNQLCFKGGRFEVSISLPGPAGVMAYWPGAWTMGNLGRPGYLATTEGMWPYTYNDCDVGITPNQSDPEGISRLPGQRLPSCTCPGEDHPTPGTGRGAPEIDILEAGATYLNFPIVTQSYQVAPFDIWYYPNYDFTAYPNYNMSYPNTYTGGPFQQALSATTMLNKNWYDGKAYQKYAFEYTPGLGPKANIAWFVGNDMMWMMDQRAVGPNGNIGNRPISEEPMTMILNSGFSNAWTYIDWAKLSFPTVMRVDYVRWYQPKGKHNVTCDPPGYETTQYIKDHMDAYTNPNWTTWDQTGYGWPKHKLNSNC